MAVKVPAAQRDSRPGEVPSPVSLWVPIILAPALALLDQQVGLAMMAKACAHGWYYSLHAPAIIGLLVELWFASIVWSDWKRLHREAPSDRGGVLGRSRFMVVLGASAVVVALATVLAMWIPVFYLTPCVMT